MKLDDNFLEAIGMHSMTEADQKRVLSQLVREANEDSRKQAMLDPLSRIPMALNEIRAVVPIVPGFR